MSAINFFVCHIFTLKTESCFKLSVLHCSMIPIRVIATKIPTSLHKIASSGLRIKILHTISHNEPSVSFLSFVLVSFFQKKERGKHFNWSEKNVNAKAVGTRYIVFVLYMYVYLVWLFIIYLLMEVPLS